MYLLFLSSCFFWKLGTLFPSENFHKYFAKFTGVISQDLTLFFQRFAKLMKYQQSPGEVAVHLRKIETFLKERGVCSPLVGSDRLFPVNQKMIYIRRARNTKSQPCERTMPGRNGFKKTGCTTHWTVSRNL